MNHGGGAAVDQELVTVAIPARNEEATIGPLLDSVLAQTHTELQVVVVDGVSDDRTRTIVEEYCAADPRVELVLCPPSSCAAAAASRRC